MIDLISRRFILNCSESNISVRMSKESIPEDPGEIIFLFSPADFDPLLDSPQAGDPHSELLNGWPRIFYALELFKYPFFETQEDIIAD